MLRTAARRVDSAARGTYLHALHLVPNGDSPMHAGGGSPLGRNHPDGAVPMNKVVLGLSLALGAAIGMHSAAPAAQYGVSVQPALASSVTTVQWDDRYCRRLRRACEFKHERGEAGEGNCRRYR